MTDARGEGRIPKAVWWLALVHLALAVIFAQITPVRQSGRIFISRGAPAQDIGAPDERQHVNYVQYLRQHWSAPVLKPGSPDLNETYQSHQPPVAYLLGAVWTAPAGDDPVTLTKWLRVLNAVLGALLVVVVGRYAFGRAGPLVGTLSAAAVAVWPMMLGLSGAWSNDVLLFLLAALALLWMDKGIAEGFSAEIALTAGLFIGLAILTKTTAIGLLPAALFAWFGSRRTRAESGARGLNFGWVAILLPILIAAPIWYRNQTLYGDPLALKAFGEAFVGSAQAKDQIALMGVRGYWLDFVGGWTVRSFLGVFGYMDVWLTNTGLPGGASGLYQLGLLVVVGGLLSAISKPGRDPRGWPLAVFAIFVLLSFLRFNAQYFQAQARYLLPAILALAFWMGCGWARWGTRRVALAWIGPATLLFMTLFALAKLPGEFAKRVDPPPTSLGGP